MPTLVDYNQVFISNLVQQPGVRKGGVNEGLVRHMVLNSLRSYRRKFFTDYGELVIACDNRNYWRKSLFPYYKAHRKKNREDSGFDWNEIFRCLNEIKAELKSVFPYKVLECKTAEADDVIATVCKIEHEPILILSGDKDFVQLQSYPHVKQYSPIQKKFLNDPSPNKFLKAQIMRGDRGDGIPNFLSKDDVFVNGGRQAPLSKKKIELWLEQDPEMFCDYEMLRGYKRNRLLIDLNLIPESLENEITMNYHEYECNDRSGLLNYFIHKRLKNLTENIEEF
jgi:hypothetical protein